MSTQRRIQEEPPAEAGRPPLTNKTRSDSDASDGSLPSRGGPSLFGSRASGFSSRSDSRSSHHSDSQELSSDEDLLPHQRAYKLQKEKLNSVPYLAQAQQKANEQRVLQIQANKVADNQAAELERQRVTEEVKRQSLIRALAIGFVAGGAAGAGTYGALKLTDPKGLDLSKLDISIIVGALVLFLIAALVKMHGNSQAGKAGDDAFEAKLQALADQRQPKKSTYKSTSNDAVDNESAVRCKS